MDVYSYFKCDAIWESLTSSEREFLLSLAEQIWNEIRNSYLKAHSAHEIQSYKKVDHSVPVIVIKDLPQKLIDKEIVANDNNRLSFSLRPLFFFAQAHNFINSNSLEHKSVQELLDVISKLMSHLGDWPFEARRHLFGYAVASLVNQFNRIDMIIFLSTDSPEPFSQVYSFIYDPLHVLNLEAEVFASLFVGLIPHVEFHTRFEIRQAIKRLGYDRPQLGIELTDHLTIFDDTETTELLTSLVKGIALSSDENLSQVIKQCEAWLDTDRINLYTVALWCLLYLSENEKYPPDKILSSIESLVEKQISGLEYTLAGVTTYLGTVFESFQPNCLNILKRLKQVGSLGQVNRAILDWMTPFQRQVAFDYYVGCLSLLTDFSNLTEQDIRKITEDVLTNFTHDYPRVIWDFLQRWTQQQQSPSLILHGKLAHLIEQAYQSASSLGQRVIAAWLTSPSLPLVVAAQRILLILKITGLDTNQIAEMPAQTIKILMERLFMNHAAGVSGQLFLLFHNVMEHTAHLDELSGYFETTFWELAWNYPGEAERFFGQTITDSDDAVTRILATVQQRLRQYHDQRPNIFPSELAPSLGRVQKYSELERKLNRYLQEASFRQNVPEFFAGLPELRIARGRRTFHMNSLHPDEFLRRAFIQTPETEPIISRIEWPRSFYLDPEGDIKRRIRALEVESGLLPRPGNDNT